MRYALLPAVCALAAAPSADAVELPLAAVLTPQERHSPLLTVQAPQGALVANTTAIGGRPVTLAISLPAELTAARDKPSGPVFLMFRDVPENVTFSTGFRLRESWAVSLKDISNVVLYPPAGLTGQFLLRVTLYRGESIPPQTSSFTLTLSPAEMSPNRNVPTAAYAPDPAAKPKPSTALNKAGIPAQEERELLARTEGLLKSGDFESARLLLAELAERGSQLAAYRMGQTFDPEMLNSRFVIGLTPDIEKARHWYRLAADLGALEAQTRLEKLADKPSR